MFTREGERMGFGQRLLIGLIHMYRFSLAGLLGGRCRYLPTCSEFGLIAVRRFGALRGGLMTARRILRCHPWHVGGHDPVPVLANPDRIPVIIND